ncbi:16S rRNA (uracil(1498)-N(3))-methyltransferase [Streptococcus sp. CSL10205-OR2]|uniref:16S rRNA (uracil(1498)-N(3))-methyltransferase n=1 Tax=Streptococcus sp. CSL10205-OR2 TaxID=2980558 RepID=UPI0021D8E2D6|nr:16S rRNA (uracil(1498)-N(3))-methyltransferase [Streptococcus sp. CSL10205-OR2]MCU9534446.1 16S rRNA (uracil(1498)-N(3))-methyltransferase [Streptococcus sp. CSL10205-OR2]
MQQYFIKGLPLTTRLIIQDKETIKHMFSVMRLANDEQVVLVFDDGVKRLAQVTNRETYELEILEELAENVELPVDVTIASGFPKGDKLEWIAQKTTELGASSIWGFPADWSVVKWDAKKLAKKREKLEKIITGASEQSKRNRLPEVQLFASKSDFLAQFSQFDKILIAYEESAKTGEKSQLAKTLSTLKKGEKILFIFGPEGGLSPEEIKTFQQYGAITLGLGPRILRTETAPLYALSAISYALELDDK